jgi:dipeptidyl aminopeptidase/acylaminoacyl peptidase
VSARGQLLFLFGLLALTGVLYLSPLGGARHHPQTEQSAAFDGDAVQVSPDGTEIAFLRGPRFQRDIWIAPIGHIADAHALGLATEQGVLQFQWSPDGNYIIFRRPFDVLAQVYRADVATGEAIALNPFANTTAGELTLSPRHPGEALLRLGPSPDTPPDLYRVNLESGALTLLEPRGPVGEYYADQDFNVRAGRTLDQYGFTIFSRDSGGWQQKLFVARQPGELAGVLFLGRDAGRIYILDDDGRETIALSSVDLATGSREVLAAEPSGDIADVLRDPATSDIFAYAVAEGDGLDWQALDPAYAEDVARLDALPGGAARVLSQSLDNRIWTIKADDAFYIFDRDSGNMAQITS